MFIVSQLLLGWVLNKNKLDCLVEAFIRSKETTSTHRASEREYGRKLCQIHRMICPRSSWLTNLLMQHQKRRIICILKGYAYPDSEPHKKWFISSDIQIAVFRDLPEGAGFT